MIQPDRNDQQMWHRSAEGRGRAVRILVDGSPVDAFDGESLAMALGAAGYSALRHSPEGKTPRAAFCLMGVCQECVVEVDGMLLTSCMEPVRDGMKVALDWLERQREATRHA